MFIKIFKPKTPSLRNKKIVTSFLCSKNFFKNLKFQFFKEKINNKHKFLNFTNSIYRFNINKILLGSSILINILKLSYKNSFFGFFEYFDNSICIKKLSYGFSFKDLNNNFFLLNFFYFQKYNEYFKYDNMQKVFLYFFDINSKFFLLKCFKTKKVYSSSAGTFCCIKNIELDKGLIYIKLPSKFLIFFDFLSTAYIGRVSNIYSKYCFLSSFTKGKILKHKKQSVRGIAKNPVDHPNGGRSKVKTPFLNPWGSIAKHGK